MSKKVPELNSSSSADIAFLLLSYFLMTTTMNQDSGLQRSVCRRYLDEESGGWKTRKSTGRNIIYREDKLRRQDLFAGNEPMDVSLLKDKVKEFLVKP